MISAMPNLFQKLRELLRANQQQTCIRNVLYHKFGQVRTTFWA